MPTDANQAVARVRKAAQAGAVSVGQVFRVGEAHVVVEGGVELGVPGPGLVAQAFGPSEGLEAAALGALCGAASRRGPGGPHEDELGLQTPPDGAQKPSTCDGPL
ncbi:hypothetical protein [Streptomyces sp. NPDC002587]